MIAYSCNLSCAGCISLSDIKRNGVADYDDIVNWCVSWSKLVAPEVVCLFGGEPLLHPRVLDLCKIVRDCWPDCTLRIITNRYLLDSYQTSKWFDFAPVELQISIHRKDHESIINDKIKKILLHKKNWRVARHGGSHHKQIEWSADGVSIYKSIFKDFIIPYKKINDKIEPWNSDPAAAHKICGSPNTPILYNGKLYKCPPVANIIDLTKQTYKDYQGYSTADNLEEFITNIGKPESVCGFCPDQNQAVVVDHFDEKNVIVKQKISY